MLATSKFDASTIPDPSIMFNKNNVPELTRHELNRIIQLEPKNLAMALYLQLMVRGENPEDGRVVIRNIISMVDGKLEKLVEPLLRCFRQSVQSVPTSIEPVAQTVIMLSMLGVRQDCPLRAAIWRSGVLAILLDAFDLLCKITQLQPHDQRILDAWHQTAILILNCAESKHDRALLNEIFQHGFVKAFVTCFPDVGPPNVPQVRAHVVKLLTNVSGFLPYTSVLRAIEPAIGSIPRTVHQRMVDSPLGSAWRAFLRCFVERLVFKWHRDFILSRLDKKAFPCDSCGKEVDEIKKCAACNSAHYCSKECQLAAWKGHKSYCKQYQHKEDGSYNNGLPPVPPQDELRFMYHVASNDAHRHQSTLRAIASRKHSNVSLKQLSVFVDYSEVPPVLDVYPFTLRGGAALGPKAMRDTYKVTNSVGDFRALEFCIPNNGIHSCFQTDFKPPAIAPFLSNGSELSGRPGPGRVQFVDTRKRPTKASLDVVDELMLRSGITADVLLDTDLTITGIRRKVFQACDDLFGPKLMNELFMSLGLD